MLEKMYSLKDKIREKVEIAEAVAEVIEEKTKPKAKVLKVRGKVGKNKK